MGDRHLKIYEPRDNLAGGWLLLNWLWEWWTAERMIAAATMGQLVVLVVAALYARAQVREARELREDQARPFVVVDFDVREGYLVYLVVANLGKTMARIVRIDVHRPFECSFDSMVPVPMAKLKLFTDPIPSLAPGKRIEFVFDTLRRRGKELPSVYRVTLRYEGERGPLQAAGRGGTAGVVPTFTTRPFDGVGAQRCPCGLATATPQPFTVAPSRRHRTGPGVPRPSGCAPQPSPDPSGWSWWFALERRHGAGSSPTPSRLARRTRTI